MSPRPLEDSRDLTQALQLVGELLEAEGAPYAIVVVGGAALNLLGLLARPTVDVDVIAIAVPPAQGLPPGLESRLTWRRFAALAVGITAREDLVPLKLFAAADNSSTGQHARDLLTLAPTDAELGAAADWVKTQDASPAFPPLVDQVVEYVRAHR